MLVTAPRTVRMKRERSGMAATVSMLPPTSAESAIPKLIGTGGSGEGRSTTPYSRTAAMQTATSVAPSNGTATSASRSSVLKPKIVETVISTLPTITKDSEIARDPVALAGGGDHRVAEERDVHAEPAEMHDGHDEIDQRRAQPAERALDEQIGGEPGPDADDRGQASARAQDQPGEERGEDGIAEAERKSRLRAVQEARQRDREARDDQRDAPPGDTSDAPGSGPFAYSPPAASVLIPSRHPLSVSIGR